MTQVTMAIITDDHTDVSFVITSADGVASDAQPSAIQYEPEFAQLIEDTIFGRYDESGFVSRLDNISMHGVRKIFTEAGFSVSGISKPKESKLP